MFDPATGEEYMDNIIKDHMEILEPKITEQYMGDFKSFITDKSLKHTTEAKKALKVLKKNLVSDKIINTFPKIQKAVAVISSVLLCVAVWCFIHNDIFITRFLVGSIATITLASVLVWMHITRKGAVGFNDWLKQQEAIVRQIVTNGLSNESLKYNNGRYEINASISEKFINRYITTNPDNLSDHERNCIAAHVVCMKDMDWTTAVEAECVSAD
jgi:hypothetical protein